MREDRMSLLEAIHDPIRLDVYTCPGGMMAKGDLYIDDGETNAYESGAQTKVHFFFDGETITVTKTLDDDHNFTRAAEKRIDEIVIYGVEEPADVLNAYAMSFPGQAVTSTDFVYIASTREVHITGVQIPVDNGLKYNEAVPLVQLIY